MKPKSFSKKLKINKKTIANLNNGEMNKLKGGMMLPTVEATCYWHTGVCISCGCERL